MSTVVIRVDLRSFAVEIVLLVLTTLSMPPQDSFGFDVKFEDIDLSANPRRKGWMNRLGRILLNHDDLGAEPHHFLTYVS